MIRSFFAVVATELVGPADDRFRAPAVPPSWDLVRETPLTFTVFPMGRTARPDIWFHVLGLAYHAATEKALVAAAGRAAIIRELATRVDPLTMAEVRALASGHQIKVLWPDDRPRLVDEDGNDLGPDPDAPRFALRRTFAGFDYGTAAEETTEVPT